MSLSAVFNPRSIAVIGASHQLGSVGNDLVKNLVMQKYQGKVFPINPKGGMLYGLLVQPDVKSVREQIDLAIIAVPAAIVPQVLIEVGKKKVKAALVISAGFRESGNPEAENELVSIAKKYKLTLVGPNCMGVINTALSMNATFAPVLPPQGKVAFVSQSGALGAAALDYAKGTGLGFSKFISIGNKALVGELEVLEYLHQDPQTSVILLYVEQLNDLPGILRLAQRIQRGPRPKPIIVLKSGRTQEGKAAARSHTGAIGGSEAAYHGLFAQSGMIRAESMEEFFLLADCFAHNRLPAGNRVAIITNAGGPGVIASDQLIHEGLRLAQLSPPTLKELQKFLPPAANIHNPVDILGDAGADRYERATKTVLSDSAVDALLIILTPQSMTQIPQTARAIVSLKRQSRKPIITSFIGDNLVAPGIDILQHGDVSTSDFPEPGAHALSILNRFRLWSRKKTSEPFRFSGDRRLAQKILKSKTKDGFLLEPQALSLMKAYKIPTLRHEFVSTESQVARAVQKIGGKCVLKVISPDILHKSDVGGVLLNVTIENADDSIKKIKHNIKQKAPRAKVVGYLVAEQIGDGFETIIGGQHEVQTGAYLLLGLGGVYTEVFKKSARFGLVPLTRRDAEQMVESVEFSPIFQGLRGQPKLDRKSLIDCLGRVSQLLHDNPEIIEMDLNPVVVLPQGRGVKILDARVRIGGV